MESKDSLVGFIKMPKSARLNACLRRKILEYGYADMEFAAAIKYQCRRDPEFFINAFCWIQETRPQGGWEMDRKYGAAKELPFITRPYQDRVIRESKDKLGHEDLIVWKSREMGVTLLYLAMALWNVLFVDKTQIGLVSQNEDKAASTTDPNSLTSMFGYMLSKIPIWLRGKHQPIFSKSESSFTFDNGSSVTSYAATGDFVRGGRKAFILMDEFHFFPAGADYAALDASVDATYSRVIVSTVNRLRGCTGAFYDLCHDPEHNGNLITLDWWEDLDKARGLYHSERISASDRYELVIDDVAFWNEYLLPNGEYQDPHKPKQTYKFVLDGKKRSIYFDHRARRPGATTQSVEAEIGRKFGSSSALLCQADIIEPAIARAKPAIHTGEIYKNPQNDSQWLLDLEMDAGNATFWCPLDKSMKPPEGQYTIGIDIAAGTGSSTSSYSCFEVFNRQTGENVAEWRSNRVGVLELVRLALWYQEMFYDAILVPESNGSLGAIFISSLVELRKTANVYRRRNVKSAFMQTTDFLGYHNSDGGRHLITNLQDAIHRGKAKVNSTIGLREMLRYLLKEDKVFHSSAPNDEDRGSRGKAHGDAAIALGCGWLGVVELPTPIDPEKQREINYGSFAERRRRWEEKNLKAGTNQYWRPWNVVN